MKIRIDQNGETWVHEFLNGAIVLGGSPSDDIYIQGLPTSLLVMQMKGTQLIVIPREPIKIGGLLSPASKPRLVFTEEPLRLRRRLSIRSLENTEAGASPHAPPTTSALALHLLAGRQVSTPSDPGVLCLTGTEMGRHHDLVNGMTLGRGTDASIRLRDRSVSRTHASLHFTHRGCWISNLGGANGIFLNDRNIRRAAYLEDGDLVRLGQSLLRIFLPRPETSQIPWRPISWPWLAQLRLGA